MLVSRVNAQIQVTIASGEDSKDNTHRDLIETSVWAVLLLFYSLGFFSMNVNIQELA